MDRRSLLLTGSALTLTSLLTRPARAAGEKLIFEIQATGRWLAGEGHPAFRVDGLTDSILQEAWEATQGWDGAQIRFLDPQGEEWAGPPAEEILLRLRRTPDGPIPRNLFNRAFASRYQPLAQQHAAQQAGPKPLLTSNPEQHRGWFSNYSRALGEWLEQNLPLLSAMELQRRKGGIPIVV